MKKVIISVLTIVLLFTRSKVFATCYDDALNNWSEKLSIKQIILDENYIAPEGVDQEELDYYSYLLLFNLPRNDLKVVASDTYSNETYDVAYDEKYKNFVMGSEFHSRDKIYKITVYMSDDADSCPGEVMKTITYTVPKYNYYHDTIYCNDNPNDELCGAYTEVSNTKDANEKVKSNYDDMIKDEEYKSSSLLEKLSILFKEYYLYVLIPLIILTIVYSIVIFIAKKRRENK